MIIGDVFYISLGMVFLLAQILYHTTTSTICLFVWLPVVARLLWQWAMSSTSLSGCFSSWPKSYYIQQRQPNISLCCFLFWVNSHDDRQRFLCLSWDTSLFGLSPIINDDVNPMSPLLLPRLAKVPRQPATFFTSLPGYFLFWFESHNKRQRQPNVSLVASHFG